MQETKVTKPRGLWPLNRTDRNMNWEGWKSREESISLCGVCKSCWSCADPQKCLSWEAAVARSFSHEPLQWTAHSELHLQWRLPSLSYLCCIFSYPAILLNLLDVVLGSKTRLCKWPICQALSIRFTSSQLSLVWMWLKPRRLLGNWSCWWSRSEQCLRN